MLRLPNDVRLLTALAAQYKRPGLTATASLLRTYITEKVERGDRPSDRKRLSPAVSLSWRVRSGTVTFRITGFL